MVRKKDEKVVTKQGNVQRNVKQKNVNDGEKERRVEE